MTEVRELHEPFIFPNGVKIKNRVLMAPMTTGAGFFDGTVTDDLVNYYAARAKDPGAVIVECCFVQKNGLAFQGAIGIDHDDKIDGLSRLAEAIHENGSKAILQLYHGGRMVNSRFIGGDTPVGPSAIAAPREGYSTPRELTGQEVEEMIEAFAQGFRRAILAGFDGVEIHGANTYLIQQFFSPHSNQRTDKWGGTREKRATFPLTILKKAHEMAEKHAREPFIIGYRFSPEELEEPGIRYEDSLYLLERLAEMGVDYFHYSLGHYNRSSIVNLQDTTPLIQILKEQQSETLANVPIMGVGSIVTEEDAEEAFSLGYDLLAVGKGYIAEPLWVNKALNHEKVELKIPYFNRQKLAIPYPLWDTVSDLISYEEIEDPGKDLALAEDGIYFGTAEGHNGPITVDVAFENGKINALSIKEHNETAGIINQVGSVITESIVENQTLNVDAISGATVLSNAIVNATQDAIRGAGGNPIAYRKNKTGAQSLQEDLYTDMIVIGSGGAGLTAALRGIKSGKNVVVLEKNGYIGGATILNGSNIVATGSKLATKIFGKNNDDSPDKLYEDIKRASHNTQYPELTRSFVNTVGNAVDWISEHANIDYFAAQTQANDHQVDRQVEVVSSSSQEVIHHLASAIKEKGGQILTNTKAEEMIIEDGQLKGIRVSKGNVTYSIYSKVVVLATGGYGANPHYRSEEMEHVLYYGPQTSTGDGLALSSPFSAQMKNLNWFKKYPHGWEVEPGFAKLTTYSSKKATDMGGIYVNSDGKRLMDETAVYSKFRDKIEEQDDKVAWLLMDEEIWKGFYNLLLLHGFDEKEVQGYLAQNGKKDPVVVEGTLVEVAEAAGVDAEALTTTVATYNQYARQGKDESFGKSADSLKELTGEKYYLVEQKARFATSLGGLVVNPETMKVLNEQGEEIPALYAAGELVGGANGNDSMPSMMNSWIVTSGYIAGGAAAKEINQSDTVDSYTYS